MKLIIKTNQNTFVKLYSSKEEDQSYPWPLVFNIEHKIGNEWKSFIFNGTEENATRFNNTELADEVCEKLNEYYNESGWLFYCEPSTAEG